MLELPFVVYFFALFLGAFIALNLLRMLRIIKEYERGIIFRRGRFSREATPGFTFLIPWLDNLTKVDMRTMSRPISAQEALSRDNVQVRMSTIVWLKIVNARASVIAIRDPLTAVEQVAVTSLLTMIGKHNLDELLKSRDTIATELKTKMDAITEAWGVEVSQVEIQNIEIPQGMQRAMAAEAEAGREKNARIIKASGEAEAATKLAEAGHTLAASPGSIELRRMEMLTQIGADQNTTTIVCVPMEFLSAAGAIAGLAGPKGAIERSDRRRHRRFHGPRTTYQRCRAHQGGVSDNAW